MKKTISILLSVIMLISVISVSSVTASAATNASITTGTYGTIKNVASGKYLNVYGSKNANNTNVTIYQKDGTSGQSVKFTKNGSGYTLQFKCSTSRSLNIYGTSAKENANVCIWDTTKSTTQTWIVEKVSKGYVFRSANNQNYVLTANGTKNSSNVCVKKYKAENTSQIWSIEIPNNKTTTNTVTSNANSEQWLWPSKTKK